jgi:hypothetical protein
MWQTQIDLNNNAKITRTIQSALGLPEAPRIAACGGHAQVFGGRDEPLDPFFRVILTQATTEHADLLSGDGFVWSEWGAKSVRYGRAATLVNAHFTPP